MQHLHGMSVLHFDIVPDELSSLSLRRLGGRSIGAGAEAAARVVALQHHVVLAAAAQLRRAAALDALRLLLHLHLRLLLGIWAWLMDRLHRAEAVSATVRSQSMRTVGNEHYRAGMRTLPM